MPRTDNPRQSEQWSEQAGVGRNLREMGQQVKETAHEQFQNLRQTASDYYEHGREKAVELEHGFENYVRERPVKSVLIAAGIGLALGFIWRRM
jgi:ElaB/YqjD/DUF883 family membrane-anchored ribosome-binding protein